MLKIAADYVLGVLTLAFLVSVVALIGTIVFQEVTMKARFDKLEYSQRLIIDEVDQYIPSVKQLIDDDKILFLKIEEIKNLWKQHVEDTRSE